MRRLPFHSVALLALLLLAVQTASLTHQHADSLPSDQKFQACDLCTALQASAPPPASTAVAHHAATAAQLLPVSAAFSLQSRPATAHRSRAPPSFRSI